MDKEKGERKIATKTGEKNHKENRTKVKSKERVYILKEVYQ